MGDATEITVAFFIAHGYNIDGLSYDHREQMNNIGETENG